MTRNVLRYRLTQMGREATYSGDEPDSDSVAKLLRKSA